MPTKFGSKTARLLLCIGVAAAVYVERPRAVRWEVLFLVALIVMVVMNLAFSWGQKLERRRVPNAPTILSIFGAEQSAGEASVPTRKPWLLICLGFVSATGMGVLGAHDTGIWLFIPAGVSVGIYFVYHVLREYR
ncbi:MAG: hypothetical protein ACLQVM_27410 [Terriglobia bacterium]